MRSDLIQAYELAEADELQRYLPLRLYLETQLRRDWWLRKKENENGNDSKVS